MDHLKIDIINGQAGPWTHLYSPFNKKCNGRDPIEIPAFSMDYESAEFTPYEGPTPDSQEYKMEEAEFEGCLKS